MSSIRSLPEIAGLDGSCGRVRIAPGLDVPLTPRVRRLVDTSVFRRLTRISQLGLVGLVYPGAVHTRFEHSLGVYRMALLFLRHLGGDERFNARVGRSEAELFIAAALLHDVGHWPFGHPVEDMRLPEVPKHETFAARFLCQGELAEGLQEEWGLDPDDVIALLSGEPARPEHRLLSSLLSGPIDADKLDYLDRDSLHAGVPYGRHFDQARLVGSLCLDARGDGLAITEKGKTAAEMMVFARYVMFSEVYWHHAVRAATAMFQRAFYLLRGDLPLSELFALGEPEFIAALRDAGGRSPAGELLDGLFGSRRLLYKRLAQYSYFESREVYERIARRPYDWLAACSGELAQLVSREIEAGVAPHELLLDAPPVEKEVEFHLEVLFLKEGRYRLLEEVSPVVRALAKEQFDDHVKRVRVFVHPRVAAAARRLTDLPELLLEAASRADARLES